MDLKPCPCGNTPEKLEVTLAEGPQPKWTWAFCGTCGDWGIEFRNDFNKIGSDQSNAKAAEAWNSAPSGWMKEEASER